jgi:hypothetical protein
MQMAPRIRRCLGGLKCYTHFRVNGNLVFYSKVSVACFIRKIGINMYSSPQGLSLTESNI